MQNLVYLLGLVMVALYCRWYVRRELARHADAANARADAVIAACAEGVRRAEAATRQWEADVKATTGKMVGLGAEVVARVRSEGDRTIAHAIAQADRVIAALDDKIGGSRGL